MLHPHLVGQAGDEGLVGADRRHPQVARRARFVSQLAVFDVQFNQRLGMLRYEGDRHHHDRPLRHGGLMDHRLGRRLDPFQPTDPALIGRDPVEIGDAGRRGQRRRGAVALSADAYSLNCPIDIEKIRYLSDSKYSMTSLTFSGSFNPPNAIFVPGTIICGAVMKAASFSGVHFNPTLFIADE